MRFDEDDPAFQSTLDSFRDYIMLERGCSENTLKAYVSDLKQWYSHCRRVGSDHAPEFDNIALPPRTVRQGMSCTVQRNAAVLSSFARYPYTTAVGKMPILTARKTRPFRRHDGGETEIINSCEDGTALGKRDRAAIELAYGTGMRASEICSLKLKDIDRGGGLIYTRGKGDKERCVPYVGGVRKTIEEYINDHRPKLDRYKEPWLLLTKSGRKMSSF